MSHPRLSVKYLAASNETASAWPDTKKPSTTDSDIGWTWRVLGFFLLGQGLRLIILNLFNFIPDTVCICNVLEASFLAPYLRICATLLFIFLCKMQTLTSECYTYFYNYIYIQIKCSRTNRCHRLDTVIFKHPRKLIEKKTAQRMTNLRQHVFIA